MTKQLTVRDEDYDLAHDLADRLGATIDDTIARALRELGQRTPSKGGLSAAQQADLDAIRALVREARAHLVPGALNDHGYLYDWNGLPA